MSNIPSELYYAKSHEWVRDDGDGNVTIGVSDYAQSQLGDLVFIELPEGDADLAIKDECGVIESVKAASDMYSPVAGTVIEVNEVLNDAPETVNDDAYGDGWVAKIKLSGDLSHLLSADNYTAIVDAESE